jgi:biotin carboxyl carrier protein
MTEAEWLDCTDPRPMLEFLGSRASTRKIQLFVCACARRHWESLTDASRRFVEATEGFVEGMVSVEDFEAATNESAAIRSELVGWFYPKPDRDSPPHVTVGSVVAADTVVGLIEEMKIFNEITANCTGIIVEVLVNIGDAVEFDMPLFRVIPFTPVRGPRSKDNAHALAHDVFGNPFRTITILPEWRTPTVVALARAAFEERSLSEGILESARLAILSDALEDSGCTDHALLDHLRGPGPHVCGCWAVDLILGKE